MGYDYGSVLASARPDGWDDVLAQVDKQDVYTGDDGTYGLETDPHVTVLYGLHGEVHEDLICRMCQSVAAPIEVSIDGISTFDQEDHDVLKLDVSSKRLRNLNKAFRGLPHTNDYEGYTPHMTIAYLKKGRAGKYMDLDQKVPNEVKLRRMEFTPKGADDPAFRFDVSS